MFSLNNLYYDTGFQLECCNCGHSSETFEPLTDLSLEMEGMDNLPTALRSFTKVEKIEDSETKFQCQNCKEDVVMAKQLMMDKAPSVAVFHLKRFKADGLGVQKIDKHVEFPLELDLQPYTVCASGDDVSLLFFLSVPSDCIVVSFEEGKKQRKDNLQMTRVIKLHGHGV